MPVSTEDYVLKELRELEAYAFQWAARAKEVCRSELHLARNCSLVH